MPATAVARRPKLKTRYKVLVGTHAETVPLLDEDGNQVKDAHGEPVTTQLFYGPGKRNGDIVESACDLLALNGPAPMSPKFALADDPRLNDPDALKAKIAELQAKYDLMTGTQTMSPGGPTPTGESKLAPTAQPAGKIDHTTPAPKAPIPADVKASFQKMSMDELKAQAEMAEVDISKCRTKDEIIRALLA